MATPEDTIVTDDSLNEEALLATAKEENSNKNDSFPKSDAILKKHVDQPPIQPVDRSSTSSLLEVELAFFLGHQSYSLEEVKSFVEGKIIRLGDSDFQASIQLQGKTIAQARLVMVEGVPSLQIIKVGNDS